MSHASLTSARPAIQLDTDARAAFLTKTYAHLFGAILAFTGIEIALFTSGLAERIAIAMSGTSWLLILGGFMLVSWLASRAAFSARSLVAQYLALGAMVVAQALIFVPMLYLAQATAPGVIQSAALTTAIGFTGLTLVAFWTRKDFSFLGALLRWFGIGALVAIVSAVIFGFQLGTWFSVGMVVFAGAAVLYDTSNVLKRFPEDRYVAASLQLFASIALMLWYVLRLFMNRD